MKVKLTKWGNSMGIRLPAEAIKFAHLQAGSELRIKVNERQGRIVLEPVKQPKKMNSDIDSLPWQVFLEQLWSGEML